ncbi:MAG: ComEC/Rec2 family competence protein [Clostridiaceae bacterium]
MFKFKLFIEKPLVVILISLIVGIMLITFYSEAKLITCILLVIFFIITFITIEIKFFIIILLTVIIGSVNFSLYFSSTYEKYNVFNVRVEKVYSGIAIGSIDGKKVAITGETKNLKEGGKYLLSGSFKKEINLIDGSLGEINVSKIINEKKDLIYTLNLFKLKIQNKFIKVLGVDKAAVVLSLSFGNTDLLSEMQKDSFKDLGIIHAVSVSGFHIALIYKLIQCFLGGTLAVILTFLYVVFTGLKAVTLRSFFMILVLVLSKKVNKKYDSISSLALSAIILLCIKPYLIYDIGFVLSYLSTFSIFKFNRVIMKKLYKLPQKLNEGISISVSAMVLTLPYILIVLRNFSIAFLLGNLFLVPIYTLVVILGNLALVFNLIPYLFNGINYLLYLLLCCSDGVTYYLLKITPTRTYGGIFHSIMIISLFFAFFLYKRGYRQFKYIPLIFCIILLFYNYTFFPTVEYVKYNKNYCFVLRSKEKSILLSNITFKTIKEENEIKGFLEVDHIKDINFISKYYKLDNNFCINNIEDKEKKVVLYLNEDGKNYLLGEEINNEDSKNLYDIINMSTDINKQKAYIPQTITKVIFLFGKPIVIR